MHFKNNSWTLFLLLPIFALILIFNPSSARAQNNISGQIQALTFDETSQTHKLTIFRNDTLEHYQILPTTQIRKVIKIDQLKKGDQIISDQNGTLLPVDFKSNLNPPERPEDRRPPEKPDQTRPDETPPPPPSNQPPHGGPPPADQEDSGMPPSEDAANQEAPSAPKKKPWEIEMENAVEPEDSLNLATHPLSKAGQSTSNNESLTDEKSVLHNVKKISQENDEIKIEALSENGEEEIFEVQKDKLVYQLVSVDQLKQNAMIEIQFPKDENEKNIIAVILR